MESVSLSVNEIKKALAIIGTAKAHMPSNWYNWIETVIIDEPWNREVFNILKRKFINGEEFAIKTWEQDSDLKKIYSLDTNLRFKSKEYIKTGKGKFHKDYHLILSVPILKIVEVLGTPITGRVLENNYIISCANKCLVRQLKGKQLEDMIELCKILQLSDNYHLHDCGQFDIDNMSQEQIIANLHKFKKLV